MLDSNVKKISLFLLCTSTAIALPASWVYCDMLLLRLHFDYALFGVIKSSMFLLPALIYWGTCGYIRRLNRCELVCRWNYLARILIPLIMPAMALLTDNSTIRMWACIISLCLSYSAAMLANNTLLILYQKALPPQDFNKYTCMFAIIFGLPCTILSIPIAWLLNRMPLDDRQFIFWYMIYEIILGLGYIPAFLVMRNLKIRQTNTTRSALSLRQYLTPFKDRNFHPVLLLNLIQSLWVGMVSSYWNIYLLTKLNWDSSALLIAEATLVILGLFIMPRFGILADRRGYSNCFAWINGILLATAMGGCLAWEFSATVFVMLLLIHNANSGVVSLPARQLIQSASVGFSKSETLEQYIAVSSLIGSIGCFAGCCLSSHVFAIITHGLQGTDISTTHYRMFFFIANLLLIPQLILSFFLKKNTPSH